MSVKSTSAQRSFYHSAFLCQDLLGPTHRYRLFREEILPKLQTLRSQLESLYCEDNGRPAIDPVILAGVTLLQFMERVADRAAGEHVVFHLGWKYALDLELTYEGFHPTVLVYFRDRLQGKKAERVIFDGVVDLLTELGLVKKRGPQRLDSTHVVGYVKEMSRLDCATETVRLALEALDEVQGAGEQPEFWDRLWTLYVQSKIDWRLSKAERENRYRQCGRDMQQLLRWLQGRGSKLNTLKGVKLLRRVFEEQFEVVGKEIYATGKRPSRAVQNPHDPDAHYADKGKKQWVGYKVHVVESVDPESPAKRKGEPGENFITEVVTTEAALDEMAGLDEALKEGALHHGFKPEGLYADGGYVTERTLSEAEAGGMELIGPTRPAPHPGPYNADAFLVDIEKHQAVCPQGNKNTQWSRIRDTYMGTEYYRIEWGSQCDRCPVQKQCTRSKSGRRILVVGLRHDLVQKRRREMREKSFIKKMYPRNGIEGTLSELVRGHGLRRTKYRGFQRVRLSHYMMGAACNIKRYLNLRAFEMKSTASKAA
jgi:transposase